MEAYEGNWSARWSYSTKNLINEQLQHESRGTHLKRVFARQGQVVLLDVPEPELRRGEVLIETAFSAISVGTEMWLLNGSTDPAFVNHEYPTTPPSWPKIRSEIRRDHPLPRSPIEGAVSLGYSMAGVVKAVDDAVVDLQPGDLVAASGSQCAHHAEMVSVPRNLVARVPEGVSLRDASLVTLGSVAVAGLRATNCRFGESVVLYGLGLLGLLAAQIGQAAGFRIIGIDIEDSRLELARELGVADPINAMSGDVVEAVKERTDGYGADAVVLGVRTESSEPLNLSCDMCRQGGRIVAQGLFGMEIERSRFYRNQVQLVPSIGYGLGRYDPVYEEGNIDYPIGLGRWTGNRNQEYFLDLVASGRVSPDLIAQAEVDFSEAPKAYEQLSGPDRPPTVVLRHDRPQ